MRIIAFEPHKPLRWQSRQASPYAASGSKACPLITAVELRLHVGAHADGHRVPTTSVKRALATGKTS